MPGGEYLHQAKLTGKQFLSTGKTYKIMIEIAEIQKNIRDFIIDTTYTPAEQLKNDTLIFFEGIFDSMGFISLINFLEEKFSIKAEDSELVEENFESVNAISRFVESKLK
jgi:acyl carrier protein